MSKRQSLVLAPFLLLMGVVATPASAGKCEASPAACQEMQAREADFCRQNPETCERRKQRQADNKEWCEANQAECQALKDELKARREKRERRG